MDVGSWIEGVGDEVVYCVLGSLLIGVVTLAWISTGVRPLWNGNSVWLVQMQTWPNRRVLQVVHVDEASADQIRNDPEARTMRVSAETNSDDELIPGTAQVVSMDNADTEESSSSSADDVEEDAAVASATTESTAHSAVMTTEKTIQQELLAKQRPKNISTSEDQKTTSKCTCTTNATEKPSSSAPETTIRLKFLDDTQKFVGAWLSQTVGEFKRHFESDVVAGKVIRLIYRGQLLRDDSRTLSSYGLHDNCIVHCHVSTTPYQRMNDGGAAAGVNGGSATDAGGGGAGQLDVGRYLHVLLTLKFMSIWAFFALYPQYFDFAGFFSLVLCTAFYALFLLSAIRRSRRQRQPTPNTEANTPSNEAAVPTS